MSHLAPFRPLALGLPLAVALVASMPAAAGPECTTEPESKWLSEQAMKERIAALGYADIKVFKRTKGNCYEIYGRNREGRRVEVYFNPIDGSVVRENID